MKLVLTGGGTGGHIYPNLAVAEALRRRSPDVARVYLGSRGGMEGDLVRRASLPFHEVASAPLLGASPVGLGLGLLALLRGVLQAYLLLGRLGVTAVLATGGYVSAPVVVAAWLRRIPSLVYLPDIVPGWSVRLLARMAQVVAVTHPASRAYLPAKKVAVTGYPLRSEVGSWSKRGARERLGLPLDGLVLLVWGGSRGARSLNQAVLGQLESLTALAHVVHITGGQDAQEALERRGGLAPGQHGRYHVYPYLDDEFAAALAAADLAVSRAGASILGEYPAVGLPSVLVPYPGLVRQQENAQALLAAGGAVILEDQALAGLVPMVKDLLARPDRLERLAAGARSLAPASSAAEELAHLFVELASPGARPFQALVGSEER